MYRKLVRASVLACFALVAAACDRAAPTAVLAPEAPLQSSGWFFADIEGAFVVPPGTWAEWHAVVDANPTGNLSLQYQWYRGTSWNDMTEVQAWFPESTYATMTGAQGDDFLLQVRVVDLVSSDTAWSPMYWVEVRNSAGHGCGQQWTEPCVD